MKIRSTRLCAFLLGSFIVAIPGQAGLIQFNNRANWEAAVAGPIVTEDFESTPSQSAAFGGDLFDLPNFDLEISPNHGAIAIDGTGAIFGAQGFFGDLHPTGTSDPQFMNILFDSPISAFGAEFQDVDGDDITFAVTDGSASRTFPSATTFFGFVSDVAFTSIAMGGGNAGGGFFRMDNVSINSAVPEPSSAIIWATLGAAFTVRRRRRRQNMT